MFLAACRVRRGLSAPSSIPLRCLAARTLVVVVVRPIPLPPQRHLPWLQPRLRRSASFFPWPRSAPSLDTAAQIAALEAQANAEPNDVSKHLAFFRALIATRTNEGYHTLIDRWEHTYERVCLSLSLCHLTHRPFRIPLLPSSAPTRPLKYISTHSPARDASHP